VSAGAPSPPGRCAFCGYDLTGLPTSVCPECGKAQPPPTPHRLVRAYLVWIPVLLLGACVFAGLGWGALQPGIAWGAGYTRDVELARLIVGFEVVAGLYAIAAWELFVYRARFRRVEVGRVVGGGLAIVLGGVFGAVVVFLFSAVR
jgi:hypothetical protein